MKNLLLLLSVAAIFASSCSSKIGIAKRKYGKGYYVSVSHKPKSVNSNEHTRLANKPAPEAVAQVRIDKVQKEQAGSSSKATVVAPAQVKDKNLVLAKSSSAHKTLQASANKNTSLKNNAVVRALNSSSLNKMAASKKADDTNTILLVILCFFWWLNLIAVYLHQGKKITNDFWITLILDFTFVLGVVYSILVVLDVLTFA